ncbi:MAG: aminotransferase class V-fold PLP-dependent enzyme [Bryobacterales bacterium]|nr:aminotransferase class V-fold PLP-dependent enzyme [Bryobacterales bacterium]
MFSATRRSLLRGAGLGSLFSAWPWNKLGAASTKLDLKPGRLYAELGIRPLINLVGTHTTIGASKIWPDIHDAMAEASRDYIVLEELQEKVGERIAALMGAPAAMVTSGCAGAISIGTCAALAGDDPAKIKRLPDLTGMKTEVIIQKVHRNGYDHAVRNAGVKIVEVSSLEELERAAGSNTAMLYFLGGTSHDYDVVTPISLEDCLKVAHRTGFPVMVDAANMLPPWENLRKLAAMKVDMICVSGGKHMRGPQCSGILAGRKDLVRAAWLNSSPHSDSLGRPMKVGREEVVGAWLAAERYAKLDFDEVDRQSAQQADFLISQCRKIKGLSAEKTPFDRTRRVHRVHVTWDENALGLTTAQVTQQLRDGEPRIAVGRGRKQGIEMTVFMNDPGDEKIAARRLKEIFSRKA